MEKYILRLAALLALILLVHACSNKEVVSPPSTDAALFAEITSSGYVYYQGGSVLTSSPPVQ